VGDWNLVKRTILFTWRVVTSNVLLSRYFVGEFVPIIAARRKVFRQRSADFAHCDEDGFGILTSF
jgi:hypothetical protein